MPDGARLEDLTPGAVLTGLADAPVTVVAVRWHGTTAVTATHRDSAGGVAERLVYRDDEPALQVTAAGPAWSFDGDAGLFRLVSEARRIRLAHLFDPMLAVFLSPIEPLPHQIQAVYGELLPRQPLHFLLADDPAPARRRHRGDRCPERRRFPDNVVRNVSENAKKLDDFGFKER